MRFSSPFLLLSLVATLGAGCGTSSPTPVDPHAGHQMEVAPSESTPAEYTRLVFEAKSWSKPGPIALVFRILGKDGGDLKEADLKIVHEKRVHLLLVRDDMTQFQHLHPTYQIVEGNGRWVAETIIPEQGTYHVYVDIAPEKEDPLVLKTAVQITGPERTKTLPSPTADNAVTTEGIKAALTTTPTSPTTGGSTRLTFTLTKNGQPETSIEPYLGAFGHVVILRHNAPEDFLHVHPVTQTRPTDGKVEFETTFMTKGRYTLYAQFNVNGSVKTFPITIDVNEGGAPTSGTMDHSQHN